MFPWNPQTFSRVCLLEGAGPDGVSFGADKSLRVYLRTYKATTIGQPCNSDFPAVRTAPVSFHGAPWLIDQACCPAQESEAGGEPDDGRYLAVAG